MSEVSKVIFEGVELDEIQKEPFFRKYGFSLIHGSSIKFEESTFINFRFRKKPTDTPIVIHDKINKLSVDKFGIPVRSLLFSYHEETAVTSGNTWGYSYFVIPKGNNYRMFASPSVMDLTSDYELIYSYGVNPTESDLLKLDDMLTDSLPDQSVFNDFTAEISEYGLRNDLSNLRDIDIIDELYDDALNDAIESPYIDEEKIEEFKLLYSENRDKVHNIVEDFLESLMDVMITEYVEGVEEIDTIIRDAEIMVYAPDGFYLVPK